MEKETKQVLERIRKYQIEKGLSYNDLADGADISSSHVYYLLNSKIKNPKIDTVIKIAKALKIPAYKLFID